MIVEEKIFSSSDTDIPGHVNHYVSKARKTTAINRLLAVQMLDIDILMNGIPLSFFFNLSLLEVL